MWGQKKVQFVHTFFYFGILLVLDSLVFFLQVYGTYRTVFSIKTVFHQKFSTKKTKKSLCFRLFLDFSPARPYFFQISYFIQFECAKNYPVFSSKTIFYPTVSQPYSLLPIIPLLRYYTITIVLLEENLFHLSHQSHSLSGSFGPSEVFPGTLLIFPNNSKHGNSKMKILSFHWRYCSRIPNLSFYSWGIVLSYLIPFITVWYCSELSNSNFSF